MILCASQIRQAWLVRSQSYSSQPLSLSLARSLSLSLSLANGGESKDAGVLKLRIGEYAGLKGEGGELFGLFLGLLSVWCLVGNGGMDYGDYY